MSNQVKLESSDHVQIMVGMLESASSSGFILMNPPADREIIERSVLLKNMIDDLGEAATVEAIPISNVRPDSFLLSYLRLT